MVNVEGRTSITDSMLAAGTCLLFAAQAMRNVGNEDTAIVIEWVIERISEVLEKYGITWGIKTQMFIREVKDEKGEGDNGT